MFNDTDPVNEYGSEDDDQYEPLYTETSWSDEASDQSWVDEAAEDDEE